MEDYTYGMGFFITQTIKKKATEYHNSYFFFSHGLNQ